MIAPNISVSPSSLTFTVGIAVTTNPITITNIGGLTNTGFVLTGANGKTLTENTGLSYNFRGKVISGTPTQAASAEIYTIRASNPGGSSEATITITVNAAVLAPDLPPFATPDFQNAIVGIAINPFVFTNSGGTATYSIAPNLPAGLVIDLNTGTVSGTPTELISSTDYAITATNISGSDSVSFTLSVQPAVMAPNISVSPSSLTFTVGTPVTTNPITITNSGGPADAGFLITRSGQSLSADTGLSYNHLTGVISGTPTRAVSARIYTIQADNAGGTSETSITITVNAAADTTPPSVAISSFPESANIANGDTVNATTLQYEVIFSELVSGFEIGEIRVTGTAGVTTASNFSGGVNGTGRFFRFEVVKGSLDGTVIVSIAENIAEDPAGNDNTASGDYTLTIDTTRPTITLNGDAALTIVRGTDYTDAGAMADDNIGGDITSSITTSFTLDGTAAASLNTDLSGTYIITYNVSDAASNPATAVTRTVTVVEALSPATNGVIATAAGDKIRLSFVDEQLTNNDAAPGDFTLSGTAGITVTALAVDAADDAVLILSLSGNIAKDAAVTLAYTRTAGSISGVSTSSTSRNGIVIDFAATDVDTSSIIAPDTGSVTDTPVILSSKPGDTLVIGLDCWHG